MEWQEMPNACTSWEISNYVFNPGLSRAAYLGQSTGYLGYMNTFYQGWDVTFSCNVDIHLLVLS